MLSVVLPSYNEEPMISQAAEKISAVLGQAGIDFEIIFVDDGSKDGTWTEIQNTADRNHKVRGVRFSKNFGKEAAIFAGLAEGTGDCCVVMDCDLQHPPEKVPEMYHMWQQGYEVIEGVKASRGQESLLHKASAGLFYRFMSSATHVDMSRASDFKLLDRKAVDAILRLPEKNAFFRALSSWVGFKTGYVEFDVQERTAGASKWSTKGLIRYAVTNIVAFTALPMQIVTFAGVFVFLLAVVLGVQSLVKYFMGQAVEGFTTVILLILIIGSILMMSLGIIGYYIAKIYEEVKGRPRYIVAERVKA